MSLNQYTEWIKCNELNAIQSQEIIALKERIKQLEEQNYAMRARLYAARPRIHIEKKLAIADAPKNISISELARKFDVSYGTVARYRRQIKSKEDKP